jgi:hypothetical protein
MKDVHLLATVGAHDRADANRSRERGWIARRLCDGDIRVEATDAQDLAAMAEHLDIGDFGAESQGVADSPQAVSVASQNCLVALLGHGPSQPSGHLVERQIGLLLALASGERDYGASDDGRQQQDQQG